LYNATEASVSTAGNLFSNLSQTIDGSSESSFNASKAFAYSANIVETVLASTAAFRSVMQSVPYPANAILAPIYAGSVAVMGGVNGAKIRKQKYQKGGGSGGGGSISKPSFNAGNMGRESSSGGGDSYTFNVLVEGQTVFSSVLKQNELNKQTGDKHFRTGEV
jgi:hypothetical protein